MKIVFAYLSCVFIYKFYRGRCQLPITTQLNLHKYYNKLKKIKKVFDICYHYDIIIAGGHENMTKKEKTVGKTTFSYNIEDFKDWLIEKWTLGTLDELPTTDYANAACLLNQFEKECKYGK